MEEKKVLGIGNALVDILVQISDDQMLSRLDLPKGSMTLIDEKKMGVCLDRIGQMELFKSSGGSAANTIHGLNRLGVSTGFIGKIGKDDTGSFFDKDMRIKGIQTHLVNSDQQTGRCFAFISKDSERTFATFLGAAGTMKDTELSSEMFKDYDYFHLEGYLVVDMELVKKAFALAKESGCVISVDLGSFNMVESFRIHWERLIRNHIDIVFANEDEAKALTGESEPEKALNIIAEMCDIAVVKIGKEGSLIQQGDDFYKIYPIDATAIDTTGAGDLYAAGFIYGLTQDYPLEICGEIGSVLAGNVVEVIGAKMDDNRWNEIKTVLEDQDISE